MMILNRINCLLIRKAFFKLPRRSFYCSKVDNTDFFGFDEGEENDINAPLPKSSPVQNEKKSDDRYADNSLLKSEGIVRLSTRGNTDRQVQPVENKPGNDHAGIVNTSPTGSIYIETNFGYLRFDKNAAIYAGQARKLTSRRLRATQNMMKGKMSRRYYHCSAASTCFQRYENASVFRQRVTCLTHQFGFANSLRNFASKTIAVPTPAQEVAYKYRRKFKESLTRNELHIGGGKKRPSDGSKSIHQMPKELSTLISPNRDSKEFRKLDHQVDSLTYKSKSDVLKLLYNSVIHQDDEFVAFDKPYGLAVQGGTGVHHCITEHLSSLGRKFNNNKPLVLLHRIDKQTTGVLLFARSHAIARRAKQLWNFDIKDDGFGIRKDYLAVVVGVPEDEKGRIELSIREKKFFFGTKMTIVENLPPKMINKKGIKPALTFYETLSSANQSSLLQLQMLTGYKHQIRVHLAFGLGCPILGDHKYSHHGNLKPQELPNEMLLRLQMRQAKVRTMAMHLHAWRITMLFRPRAEGNREKQSARQIEIIAPLPQHFTENMKALQLRFPYRRTRTSW